ncbi:hypothetical protein BJX66DRAFT_319105 [Aspergillus keveii]|uniref:FG-GAP repeat protein n=1 Tax=Aspergillus keveii TaxID=714993 RepID=A0ABR4FIQ1_9EURO
MRPLTLTLLPIIGHLATMASATPYQARIHETGSYFPAPADNGPWLMSYYVYPSSSSSHADLVSIQTANTNTDTVQVLASRYPYSSLSSQRTNTVFAADSNKGVWTLADYDGDNVLDLIYVQNRETASGKVEVSVASGASVFQSLVLDRAVTAFDVAVNGHWQVLDVDGDGSLDLVYIQNSGTASNMVEVHIASAPFSTITQKTSTPFPIAADGTWQMANYDNDGIADLVYIQNINTASGYVEISIASGASEYQSIVQNVASAYSTENNGVWQMIDWDNDGVLDLVYIKTVETSGSVEVHIGWGRD